MAVKSLTHSPKGAVDDWQLIMASFETCQPNFIWADEIQMWIFNKSMATFRVQQSITQEKWQGSVGFFF